MDTFHIEGILRIYELPCDEAIAEYASWWPRFSMSEKQSKGRQVIEAKNIITSAGRTQVLTFIGSTSSTVEFSQYYAVGTGTIYSVQASDTSLATEIFRAVPASYAIAGNAVTVSTNFTSAQALATFTNAALFGNGATGTANSGTMMTHILYSYTHGAIAIVNDYELSLT